MKLQQYLRLSLIRQEHIPLKFATAKKRAELEICKIENEIVKKEDAIQSESCKEDVCFDKIIDCLDAICLLERKKKQYKKILVEMFGEKE